MIIKVAKIIALCQLLNSLLQLDQYEDYSSFKIIGHSLPTVECKAHRNPRAVGESCSD